MIVDNEYLFTSGNDVLRDTFEIVTKSNGDYSVVFTAHWLRTECEFTYSGKYTVKDNETNEGQKFKIDLMKYFDLATLRQEYTKVTIAISFHASEIDDGYQDLWLAYNRTNEKVDSNGDWTANGVFKSITGLETVSGKKGSVDWSASNQSDLTSSYSKGSTVFEQLTNGAKTLHLVFGAHGKYEDNWELSNLKVKIKFE